MKNMNKKFIDRVLAIVLTVLMVMTAFPMSVSALENTQYAVITTLTGGEIKNNATADVEVTVKETTLNWVPANSLRGEGWWVGIKVEAPKGFSADAVYKSKGNPSHEYGEEKKFADMKDSESHIELWFSVSVESLVRFANEDRNITMMYTFDWNADGIFEQEITFSVVPSEKIVLMKNTEQVYPFIGGYGSVSTITGGKISNNTTSDIEVVIDEITLNWVPGNSLRAEGWWVGIKAVAPEGFSDNAAYKSKTNPSLEYGNVRKFADAKDGSNYIELWFLVTPESLVKFAEEKRNITMMYTFDWNGDSVFEQEITFSVVPSEKIVLMREGEQVYPVVTHKVSAEKNEGGVVKINGAQVSSVMVDRRSDVTIDIKAEDGYRILSVKADGEELAVPSNAVEFNTKIKSIQKDTKIEVIFIKVYTATVTHGGTGTGVSNPENGGSVTVDKGNNILITADADEGNRVVSVIINGDADTSVTGINDSGYSKQITADKDYTVVITFAPNVYSITAEETVNGTVTSDIYETNHGGNAVVTLTPDEGYTVDTVYVNGVKTENIIKDENGIHFAIDSITAHQNIKVTYKEISTAPEDGLSVDSSEALRKANGLFVIKDSSRIIFSTEKDGIRLYNADGIIGGGDATKSVTVNASVTVTKIELYYKAENEYYAAWHKVETGTIKIVVDKGDNVKVSLKPNSDANKNGYYNSNVVFTVTAEDTGDYSGLKNVEYTIICNGVKGEAVSLYSYNGKIDNTFSDSETLIVDASLYDSNDIKVILRAQDRAGNETAEEYKLMINSVKPVVSLDINGSSSPEAFSGYYNDKRELTVTIVDRDDTFSKANAAEGLNIIRDGQPVPVNVDDITWTTDKDGLHIGKYTFEADGHYEWSFSYENLAELKNEGITAPSDKYIYDFYIDKIAPYDLKVTYEPEFFGVFLENSTFGFYKSSIIVTVEAADDTAEIAQFEYGYTGSEKKVISGADIKREGKKAYAEFVIEEQFRGTVEFTVTDKAGQSARYDDERVVVIDTIAPGITVEWEPGDTKASEGKYFNTVRTATIKIEEANFFQEDIDDGLLLISQSMMLNDGTHSETFLKPEFTEENGVFVANISFEQDADYTFDIKYTDRSGNVYDSYPAKEFVIDTVKPVINVSFDNNNAVNEKFFKKERIATITVVEHNFNPEKMEILVNENLYSSEWLPVEGKADTYRTEVSFPGDAHYTFSVSGSDRASNGNDGVNFAEGTVAEDNFTVDASGPENLSITYEPTFVGILLESLTYGFYKAPVRVTIKASDDISFVDYFEYSYTVQENASAVNVGKTKVPADIDGEKIEASVSFDIPANFRGFVSFTAVNKADVSSSYADENAVVVDEIAPGITVAYDNYNSKNDSYFNADRTATIRIEEANFFTEDIEDGLLAIYRKTVLNDATVTEENLAPEFTKAEGSDIYTATIKFDKDADYIFDIRYKDRSENIYDSYESDSFTVDKIKPVITAQNANGAYFDADRTLKITVIEHNFRASDFVFIAEAHDVLGNKIDLTSKFYDSYLRDQKNWTKVAADTWETEITFDIEGNYKISAAYTDLAGNEQTKIFNDMFCIDKSSPENLKITYNPTFLGTLLENITYGFYKAPVTVTIEATDAIAGVDHFVYSYITEDGASETSVGKSNVTANAQHIRNTDRWQVSFEIPAQFRGNVSFKVYDKSGNNDFYADANAVIVDNVAPGVNVEYSNHNSFYDNYFSADRTAVLTITEANFFGKADINDNYLVITVGKTLNDGTYTSSKINPEFTKNGDVYTAKIHFDENADYTFDIKYTDRSGNVYDSYETDSFTVDKIRPVIKVSYNDEDALYSNKNCFRTDRTATITVTEHNFDASNIEAKVMSGDSELKEYAEYLKDPANWSSDGDIHTAKVKYTREGHYTFDIGYTDKSGNTNSGVDYGNSVAPVKFTVDKSAPDEMNISIDDILVTGSMTTLAFDRFYGEAVTVKLSANFDISGMQSMKYQKVSDEEAYKEDGKWIDYDAENGISVSPSEKFIIYFRAEDKAGNVSIIRSTGIVVDNRKPVGETKAPEIDILPEEANDNGIHNDDVRVDLKVIDPKYVNNTVSDNGYYSGLKKITYKIYTTDTDALQEGTLFALGSVTSGAEFDKDKLVSSWSGSITIDADKFNSNSVIVEVTATDNAGNTRTTKTVAGAVKIDITAPKIEVSFDNNNVDSDSFFDADRTATISVTERNFNADDVMISITNADGTVPAVKGWTKTSGTGNADNTVWTATITFDADGDYDFSIEYTDLAGWKCGTDDADYGNSVKPTAFTIDKTAPVISVSYDNNNPLNGNYYKAFRTATVVITEHNFNANRVTITNTATDNGENVSKPSVSVWLSEGDKHTATIYYTKDAKYTFDIAVNDKAGNAAADYEEETFFVDTTAPELEISGVDDKSANNGEVIPLITYSDTNFDADNVTFSLNGANRNSVAVDGVFSDILNGQTFTFRNFAEEKEVDDIYTLTARIQDKAGNSTDKTITFSVNRFGSVYALSETAKKLNGTYVQEPVDVVITETNADKLQNIKITLFKDGENRVLIQNTDYRIDVEGGDSQWYQYTYTVFAENFDADGVYSLTFESDDKAGNKAKNDHDTKDAAINFGVDSTLPIINIENIESKTTYALNKLSVEMSVMDNLKLTKVIAVLDGKEVKVWSDEELEEIVRNGGNFTFDIPGDSTDAHNLIVYAVDAAGNGDMSTGDAVPANAEAAEDFYVTTNLWVRYYTNKPLFFGSIAGVIILVGFIVFLIVYKKKKNEKK